MAEGCRAVKGPFGDHPADRSAIQARKWSFRVFASEQMFAVGWTCDEEESRARHHPVPAAVVRPRSAAHQKVAFAGSALGPV
jgi:hypothetical protein